MVKAEDFTGEDPQETVKVIHALRDGLGVEDMGVLAGIDPDYARSVISRLRKFGLLRKALGVPNG